MNAEKSGALLEGLRAQAGYLEQFLAGAKRPVLVAMADNVGGQRWTQTGHIAEQLLAGGVQFDTHPIHTRHDDVIQTALEGIGIHIVLVLADTNGLRIELHQFGQRVHQATANAHRAPDSQVLIGEFFTGHLARRINRGAAFVHKHHRDVRCQVQGSNELLGLAAGCSVADGNGLDTKPSHELSNLLSRLRYLLCSTRGGVNDILMQELALTIEHHRLAARPESGVQSEHVLLAESRCQQQFSEVLGEHSDGLQIGSFLGLDAHLGLDGESHQALEAVHSRQTHLLGSGCATGLDEKSLQDGDRRFFQGRDAYQQNPLLFTPAHGQHPVTGNLGDGLGPVEVVLKFGPFSFLARHHLGSHLGRFPVELPKTRARTGILTETLGQDIPGTGQSCDHVGHQLLGIHKTRCDRQRIDRGLFVEKLLGQRFQARLLGNSRTSTALRAERRVQVFEGGEGIGRFHGGF